MEINKQRSTVRSSASEAIIDQGLRCLSHPLNKACLEFFGI